MNRLNPWIEADVGVLHSSGRPEDPGESGNPFHPPALGPTGPSVGGGLGLDARISNVIDLRAGVHIYQDFLYSGQQMNTEHYLAVALRP